MTNHRARKVVTLTALTLAAGIPVAHASEVRPAAFETFAGISCLPGGAFPTISYKGWGVDYAHGSKIDIYLDVTGPSTLVKPQAMTTLFTDNNGAWSSPTYSGVSGGAGTYSLLVRTYSATTHAPLGEASDSCTY